MSHSLTTFFWIFGSGVIMTSIAAIGGITLVLKEQTVQKLLLPMVSFSAGTLLGGAFFHMIPSSIHKIHPEYLYFFWVLCGFSVFFALEQFLHWHHCNRAEADCRSPLTYLVLIGDGLHHFIAGIAIASTFLIDIRLGIMTWLAAAAHEIPKELGDFGVLLHGGFTKGKAILYNLMSGVTFLVGGLIAYMIALQVDVTFLVPFAAGNFIYIGASDLVPEVKHHENLRINIIHFVTFTGGILAMLMIKIIFEGAG